MPVPFGFSVGDIAYAIKLIITIGKAIRESGGAASEFQLLQQDLDSLQQTLETLKQIQVTGCATRHVKAVTGMALSCQVPLKEFYSKIEKYQATLGSGSSAGRFRSGGRKVQWAVLMNEEVVKIRAVITGKVVSVNLLMATLNT